MAQIPQTGTIPLKRAPQGFLKSFRDFPEYVQRGVFPTMGATIGRQTAGFAHKENMSLLRYVIKS